MESKNWRKRLTALAAGIAVRQREIAVKDAETLEVEIEILCDLLAGGVAAGHRSLSKFAAPRGIGRARRTRAARAIAERAVFATA